MTALVLLALTAGPPAPSVDALPDGAVARLGPLRYLYTGPHAPALSPDGRALATARAGGIYVSGISAGAERRFAFPPKVGGADRLVFSPDGSRLANFGNWPIPGAAYASVAVYSASKGEFELLVPGHGPNYPVSFSRDGGRLAVIESAFKAAVWDVAGKKRVRVADVYPHSLELVALSPDGQALAACCNGSDRDGYCAVQLWSVATGKLLGTMLAEGEAVNQVAFSPDGKALATTQPNGRLVVWDVATRKPRGRATLPGGQVAALHFAPDGKKVAVGLSEAAVEFYDAQTCKRLARGKCPASTRLTGLGFRPDGRAVAAGTCYSRVLVWDAATGKALSPTAGHVVPVQALAFRADGDLVSAAADGCRLWRAATWAEAGRAERALPSPDGLELQRAFLSPDGQSAVWSGPSSALLVDAATGKRLGEAEKAGEGTSPHSIYAFSPDGRRLVKVLPQEAKSGKGLRVWALPGIRKARDLAAAVNAVGPDRREQAAISPDGSVLAITGCQPASRNPFLRAQARRGAGPGGGLAKGMVFGLADGKKRAEFKMGDRGSVAWSPDGLLLCVTDSDGEVAVLSAAGGRPLRAFSLGVGTEAGACAFSPCGRLLAVAGFRREKKEGWVHVYETATGDARLVLKGHRGEVKSLAFSHDGRWLATGGADTTVIVWGLSGREWRRPDAEAGWDALDDEDAERAFAAIARLTRRSSETVGLIRKHLKPAPGKGLDDREVKGLIEGLCSDDFDTRQRSQKMLSGAALRLAPQLEKVRQATGDLELKERLRLILKATVGWPRRGLARTVRAVEVLERLGTPEARKFLRELAAGNADANLTLEAKSALARLEKRR